MVKPAPKPSKRPAEEPASPPQASPGNNPRTETASAAVSISPNDGKPAVIHLSDRIQQLRSVTTAQAKTVETETDQLFTQTDKAGNIIVTLVDRKGGQTPFLGPSINMLQSAPVDRVLKLAGVFHERSETDPNGTFTTTITTKKDKRTFTIHNFVVIKIPTNTDNNTVDNRKRFGKLTKQTRNENTDHTEFNSHSFYHRWNRTTIGSFHVHLYPEVVSQFQRHPIRW